MAKHSSSFKNKLLLLAGAFLFVGYFYHEPLQHPGRYLFAGSGDAIKNYYTYAWYIEKNPGHVEFSGMNYPYGEHFLYTDCHPLLAVCLRGLSTVFPGIATHDVAILNTFMLLSLVLTAYVLFLVFSELKVSPLLGILGSLAILSLSPQLFRLSGHLALSYSFAIPLTIYYILRLENSGHQRKYYVYLLLSNLVWFYTHAYLGMICTTLLAAYSGVKFLGELFARKKLAWGYYAGLAAGIVLPVAIFFSLTKLTDTHTGRTDNPWGLFEFHAGWSDVFLPSQKPFGPYIHEQYPDLRQNWEAWSYIGLMSVVFFLFFIGASVKRSLERKKPSLDDRWMDSQPLRVLWIASIFVLLFSMLYPFRWHLEFLLDKLSVIKQFRSIGRFAWVFYFVSGICTIYLTDRWAQRLKTQGKRFTAFVFILAVPIFMAREGLPYHEQVAASLVQTPNLFDETQTDDAFRQGLATVNPDEYQAIVPMPYYHIGSENFSRTATQKIYKLTKLFSYHTGLPSTGCYLTRISIWESKNLMQLFSPNFYDKAIRADLPSEKPFLLVYSNEPLSPYEQAVYDRGRVVFSHPDFTLLRLEKNAFFESPVPGLYAEYEALLPTLHKKDGFWVTDSTKFFRYLDFETETYRGPAHSGNGSITGRIADYNSLAKIDGKDLTPDTPYTIRFWIYNNGNNYGQDVLNSMVFVNQKKKNGEGKWLDIQNPSYSQVIDGDWSMVEVPFTPDDPDAEYDLTLKGNERVKTSFIIDDILIYDASLHIYRMEGKETLFMDNHRVNHFFRQPAADSLKANP